MNAPKRFSLVGALATSMLALSLAFAGTTVAAEDDTTGYPSTQSPLQVLEAAQATLDNAVYSLTNAINGDNGSELPQLLDPRFVEGPLGGLLNGPLG